MDWGDVGSSMVMCIVSLYSDLMAFKRLLALSRMNVYLIRGECNDPINHFEL